MMFGRIGSLLSQWTGAGTANSRHTAQLGHETFTHLIFTGPTPTVLSKVKIEIELRSAEGTTDILANGIPLRAMSALSSILSGQDTTALELEIALDADAAGGTAELSSTFAFAIPLGHLNLRESDELYVTAQIGGTAFSGSESLKGLFVEAGQSDQERILQYRIVNDSNVHVPNAALVGLYRDSISTAADEASGLTSSKLTVTVKEEDSQKEHIAYGDNLFAAGLALGRLSTQGPRQLVMAYSDDAAGGNGQGVRLTIDGTDAASWSVIACSHLSNDVKRIAARSADRVSRRADQLRRKEMTHPLQAKAQRFAGLRTKSSVYRRLADNWSAGLNKIRS
ncbi:MAG: hypothetical protein AAFR42_08820 [Cyanobacteria bacterium J06628_6]